MMASNEASTSTEMMSTLFRSRTDVVLDLIAAVKGLHELSPQQLTKLIKDSGNNIVRHVAQDGSHIQVDLEKFARYLPLHLIAVIMAWERDKATFKYLLCGVLLLHSMCDLESRVPKIEQILLDDVKVSEQLIDLVFYLLVLLGAYRQENQNIPNEMILLHSALVACSLKLLIVIVSPQYQEVAQVLSAYYKVDIFMDGAFSAVCIDVNFLQTKLSIEHADPSAGAPTAEETLNHLCQQCDSSLHFLQSLCQQKSFRERLVKNKELCGNGGVLVLVQAVLNLKISPLYITSEYITYISRLKSKALSILLHLCEAESVSYLDEVASNHRSRDLAKSIVLQVLELLKKMFGLDSKQLTAPEIVYPKGQLELNAMRLTDVFSDDSNFRSFIMINFAETLAETFLLPSEEFLPGWCSSDLPVCEDVASLDLPRASYAHQRTSLLIKVIANLHCFVPDVCLDEKDLFLNKFVRFIQKESQKLSNGCSSTFDVKKTTTVSKNICSLLSHAESLVPRYLNEEDVHLLRLFIDRFDSLIIPAATEDRPAQNPQTTGLCLSPLQRDMGPDHGNTNINMEEGPVQTVTFREANQSDISRNINDQCIDGERKSGTTEQGTYNGPPMNMKEIERDARGFETSGSDSSPVQGKNSMDIDHFRGSGFDESMEDEKADAMHSDDKQQRKRKRTVMNDIQIALIESALVDEPDMQRHSTSLQLWSEKLSLHGAEVTTSRLKNWLNNRKARLARQAKDFRGPYECDSLSRQGSGAAIHSDSPLSPSDNALVQPTAKVIPTKEVNDIALATKADEDSGTPLAATSDIPRPSPYFEPGQHVMLVGEKSEEIGKGKVFQAREKWFGCDLEQSGVCVVDVIELSIDRFVKLPYPMEITGDSFDEAEKRLGFMRVVWDLNKLFPLPPRVN
ncbi:hypothetical protein CASFOL_010012 [Castilleja foliolosa]|uniref:Homeobox domain-containing protein n=1 Tax=Castilleja foliolosa TaxID=1961234 RepID=A0ABD3DRW5_9LAMI